MSDNDFTDEDESDGDFSVSEEEWIPNKKDDSSDSDTESSPQKVLSENLKVRKAGNNKANSLQTLRTKLFKKYQPRAANNKTSSIVEQCQATETESESSDSGDDHLVPANKIDLNSSYFDVSIEKPANLTNINEDLKKNQSDEEEEEIERKIMKLNDCTNYKIDFNKLNRSYQKIEEAKTKLKNFKANNFVQQNDNVNVSDLLALGESSSAPSTSTAKQNTAKKSTTKRKVAKIPNHEENGNDSDWEEVDEIKEKLTHTKDLEVTVALPQLNRVQKNKQLEMQLEIQRRLNKVKREYQIDLHKTNLVCWIAHMNYVNKILNSSSLMKLATSLIPSQNCYPKDKTDIKYFEQLIKWYKQLITIKDQNMYPKLKKRPNLSISLALQLKTKTAICKRDFIFIFVILIRAIGMQCRIVMNLVTAPLRPPQSELISYGRDAKRSEKNKVENSIVKTENKQLDLKEKQTKKPNENTKVNKLGESDDKKTSTKFKLEEKKPTRITRSCKNIITSPLKSLSDLEGRKLKKTGLKDKKKSNLNIEKLNKLNSKKRHEPVNDTNSDEDFLPSPPKKISPLGISKSIKILKKIDRRVLSTDDESKKIEEKIGTKEGIDYWAEVFSEADKKWITVDLLKAKIDCTSDVIKTATHPLTYVLSWNNNNCLKDVSQRYCLQWNCVIKKRVDSAWWTKTLLPYKGNRQSYDFEEDNELNKFFLSQPLPTTISEYKDHPLYALRRHLLKFQDIYPPNAVTLGFVRNEPVYARECVYTLHSREIWLKDAKIVKPGEKPYKIVTARPKWDRYNHTVIKDQLLEIFGVWQTQPYEPPTAENGIVPRNAYGNVELFKACMLPKKTVHLQLNGLNKVCKKLKIDCAPAVVGFDFHSGYSHPTFDGFVICEEFSEIATNAWIEDQEESEKRQTEKYEARVYGNWKKLIRGLLIRERLIAKYDFKLESKKEEKLKRKRK